MNIAMDIIDRVVELKEGEKLRLHLSTYEEMKSIKTSLYRERNKYEEKLGKAAKQVIIRQTKNNDGSYVVSLWIMSGAAHSLSAYGAEIVTASGEVKDVAPDEQLKLEQDAATEQSRIRLLMKEDGLSEEEINEILKGD